MPDDGDPGPLPLVPTLFPLGLLWGALLLTDAEVAMAVALLPMNPDHN